MKSMLKTFAAGLIAASALTAVTAATASFASAETVLRLDEVAVGVDPLDMAQHVEPSQVVP